MKWNGHYMNAEKSVDNSMLCHVKLNGEFQSAMQISFTPSRAVWEDFFGNRKKRKIEKKPPEKRTNNLATKVP